MTASVLGHNPNASAAERKQHVEDLSISRHHPDPNERRAAQERLNAKGAGFNYNDFTREEKAEFDRRLREQNSRRAGNSVQAATPPAETKLSLDILRELARSVYGCDLVPIGDKPSDGAWAARAEAEKAEMQKRFDAMYLRATTAEKTAADAIRELQKLKESSGDSSNGR